MPGAVIAFNQVQGSTPTYGSPGVARNDLWQSSTLTALSTSSGNLSYDWSLLDVPPGSAATLSSVDESSTTWMPDLPGSYRLQLITNGGGAGNIQVLVAVVRYSDTGVLINRGWRLPALGEVLGEGNFNNQVRGWDEAFETIYADLLGTLAWVQAGLLAVTASSPGTLVALAPGVLLHALCATSSGACTVDMPADAYAGCTATVTDDDGAAAANPITVNGGGIPVEDPNTPGTYRSSVALSVGSASVDWMYTGVHWKIR